MGKENIYTSTDQYVAYLTKQVRLGEAYELGMLHGREWMCNWWVSPLTSCNGSQHSPLPHGAPEYGTTPTRSPLPTHRPYRRVLQ